jgi:4-amino-4-deoxy-L-arabinose transferase-like glycosyltransferase
MQKQMSAVTDLIGPKHYVLLFVISGFSLIIRLWLLDQRWINPDEGAHMMDAVLALKGMIPSVDFESRQPLHTLSLIVVFKIFGTGYLTGRSLMLLLSLSVGLTLFYLARSIYNDRVAFLATIIYLLLPLEILNSVVVKTEPLSMLMMSLSFLMAAKYVRQGRPGLLIAAGSFAALGYYVRQSALIVPVAILMFLVAFNWGDSKSKIKSLGYLCIGYFLVVLASFLFYLQYLTWAEIWNSSLNPFFFVIDSLRGLFFVSGQVAGDAGTLTGVSSQQPGSGAKNTLYIQYVSQAIKMHLFLIVGAGLSLVSMCNRIFLRREKRIMGNGSALLYLWVAILIAAYIYYFRARGFYIDYFREFLPPLIILFSSWLTRTLPSLRGEQINCRYIVVSVAVVIIGYTIVSMDIWSFPTSALVLIGLGIFLFIHFRNEMMMVNRQRIYAFFLLVYSGLMLVIFLFPIHSVLMRGPVKLLLLGAIILIPFTLLWRTGKLNFEGAYRSFALSVVIILMCFNLSYAAKKLNLKYDSVWSPKAVEEVADFIKNNTKISDKILSGAAIWELEANRRPFMNISHPLVFSFVIPEEEKKRIKTALIDQPPELIILDGYSEKTYFRQFAFLEDYLKSEYKWVYASEHARKPVRIYQLK